MVAALQELSSARWDDVRVFLAIHREHGLAAAARRLGLDMSTVSRRLVTLEEAVGVRLFDRTRDGLTPTAAAERLLPAAEAMASAHTLFALEASGFEREVAGVVRLTAIPGLADTFVGRALVRLRAKHPKLRIEVDASTHMVDIGREADIAIRSTRPDSGDLVALKVASAPWIPMASPAYARQVGRLKRWEDAEWITWGHDLAGHGAAVWFARHVHAEPVLRTSHFATQLVAMATGLGTALAPLTYGVPGRLIPLAYGSALAASANMMPTAEAWLVTHRASRHVPRVAAAWQFLLEEAEEFKTVRKPKRQR